MGVVQLTTVTAINMMGSGIILLPATLAEIGTVSIFAWILASIGATILAYAFAKCGMYSKKVGGMGGYAEYRFGRLGNFLSNYTYAISLIIANVAIATGVVSYGSYVFGFDLSPMEVCLATISTLAIAASISLVGPKKFGKFTSLGMICILLPVIGLLLCGWDFFSPDIYVAAWKRGIRVLWENTEFKVYLSIVAAATILISLNLMLESGLYAPSALLEALFTSASLSSTTGFISYDFEAWPHFSQVILLILMFIGGCGGSTSGGLKVTRIILLFKSMTAVLRQKLHPRAVIQTRAGGENFSESMLLEVFCFFFIYTMSIFLWTALIAANGADIPSALGLSIATMSNSGPALGQFGATCNWSAMPAMTKMVVALSMLMGRLESFTLLILFLPSFWRKNGW